MEKKKVKLLAVQLGSIIANLEENIKKAERLLRKGLSVYQAYFVIPVTAALKVRLIFAIFEDI